MAIVFPILIAGCGAWLTWKAVWAKASTELAQQADAGAEYARQALRRYALAADRINDRIRGLSDADITAQEEALHAELSWLAAELRPGEVSYVIDAAGYPLLSSDLYPVPRGTSLADRDFFQALSASSRPDVYVSALFTGRFDGRPLFAISRARFGPGPDARFLGLTTISVSPAVMATGLSRLLDQSTDLLALVREDGSFLSRTRGQDGRLPQLGRDRPFHQVVASGATSAVYVARDVLEDTIDLVAVRRLEGFPVYAVSLRPRAAIVAQWRDTMLVYLLFGVPATAAFLLLSLRVRRDQMALSDAMQQTSDRLSRAKRFGQVGTFEADFRTGISWRSPEYMSVQGQPAVARTETHRDWLQRLHPDDRTRAEANLFAALQNARTEPNYAQNYRIITPAGDVRYIAARGEILCNQAGDAVALRGAHVDITPLRSAQDALTESDARLQLAQEAVGIGTWEWLPATRELHWSKKMMQLWGFAAEDGQPDFNAAMARFHPEDRQRVRRELAEALTSGSFRSEFRVVRPNASGEPEIIWVAARGSVQPTPDNPRVRLLGVALDVTERKAADEQATLLAHEVEHRAKNILAVVLGILRLSVAESQEAFVRVVEGRVEAMARSHQLLARHHWNGANLQAIIEDELKSFGVNNRETGGNITTTGPSVILSPEAAQPLSMTIHELATNAVKYGALSALGGRLEVTWTIADGTVRIVWRETGGPAPPANPELKGFGSRLIRQTVEGQLHGKLTKSWPSSGLVCEIEFPL